jgi:hypothetical protein
VDQMMMMMAMMAMMAMMVVVTTKKNMIQKLSWMT